MKQCVECGTEFKPRGRQKVCGECKDAMREGLQKKTDEEENPRPERPLDRFRNRRVIVGNGGAVIMRR